LIRGWNCVRRTKLGNHISPDGSVEGGNFLKQNGVIKIVSASLPDPVILEGSGNVDGALNDIINNRGTACALRRK
jgi:hypothetical protein